MPAPLSQDLRERIVRAVENGSSIRQAALRFEVSPSAAVKLMRRVRESGSPAPTASSHSRSVGKRMLRDVTIEFRRAKASLTTCRFPPPRDRAHLHVSVAIPAGGPCFLIDL